MSKVKKHSCSHPRIKFFNISFVVLDCWQLINPPCYVAKPGITRLYRLMLGRFRVGSFRTCCNLVTSQWPFSDTTCQFQGYIVIALAVASVHTLALMAVNRYFRIVKPSTYRSYFTKKKTMIMILLSWFYSMC